MFPWGGQSVLSSSWSWKPCRDSVQFHPGLGADPHRSIGALLLKGILPRQGNLMSKFPVRRIWRPRIIPFGCSRGQSCSAVTLTSQSTVVRNNCWDQLLDHCLLLITVIVKRWLLDQLRRAPGPSFPTELLVTRFSNSHRLELLIVTILWSYSRRNLSSAQFAARGASWTHYIPKSALT